MPQDVTDRLRPVEWMLLPYRHDLCCNFRSDPVGMREPRARSIVKTLGPFLSKSFEQLVSCLLAYTKPIADSGNRLAPIQARPNELNPFRHGCTLSPRHGHLPEDARM